MTLLYTADIKTSLREVSIGFVAQQQTLDLKLKSNAIIEGMSPMDVLGQELLSVTEKFYDLALSKGKVFARKAFTDRDSISFTSRDRAENLEILSFEQICSGERLFKHVVGVFASCAARGTMDIGLRSFQLHHHAPWIRREPPTLAATETTPTLLPLPPQETVASQ